MKNLAKQNAKTHMQTLNIGLNMLFLADLLSFALNVLVPLLDPVVQDLIKVS